MKRVLLFAFSSLKQTSAVPEVAIQYGSYLLTHTLQGLVGYILEIVSASHCLGVLTGGLLYRLQQAKCALSLWIHEAWIFLGACCKLVILQEPAMRLKLLPKCTFTLISFSPSNHLHSKRRLETSSQTKELKEFCVIWDFSKEPAPAWDEEGMRKEQKEELASKFCLPLPNNYICIAMLFWLLIFYDYLK